MSPTKRSVSPNNKQEHEHGRAWSKCQEESQETPSRQDTQACRRGSGRCVQRSCSTPWPLNLGIERARIHENIRLSRQSSPLPFDAQAGISSAADLAKRHVVISCLNVRIWRKPDVANVTNSGGLTLLMLWSRYPDYQSTNDRF